VETTATTAAVETATLRYTRIYDVKVDQKEWEALVAAGESAGDNRVADFVDAATRVADVGGVAGVLYLVVDNNNANEAELEWVDGDEADYYVAEEILATVTFECVETGAAYEVVSAAA
jgi:hypothetical protein